MARIDRIEVDEEGIPTFFFDSEPNNPFFTFEFTVGSKPHAELSLIESRVRDYNRRWGGMTIQQMQDER